MLHCEPAFRKRSLGSLYLDQRFLAGNGNYLRSEILWAARLNPERKPAALTESALRGGQKKVMDALASSSSQIGLGHIDLSS